MSDDEGNGFELKSSSSSSSSARSKRAYSSNSFHSHSVVSGGTSSNRKTTDLDDEDFIDHSNDSGHADDEETDKSSNFENDFDGSSNTAKSKETDKSENFKEHESDGNVELLQVSKIGTSLLDKLDLDLDDDKQDEGNTNADKSENNKDNETSPAKEKSENKSDNILSENTKSEHDKLKDKNDNQKSEHDKSDDKKNDNILSEKSKSEHDKSDDNKNDNILSEKSKSEHDDTKKENVSLDNDNIDNKSDNVLSEKNKSDHNIKEQIKSEKENIENIKERQLPNNTYSTPEKRTVNHLTLAEFGYIESPNRNNYSSSSSSSNESPKKHNKQKSRTASPAFVTDNGKSKYKKQGEYNTLPIKKQNNNYEYTDAEIERAYDRLMEKKILPSPEMAPPLMGYINRKRIEAICESDYDTAKTMNDAVSYIIKNEDDVAVKRLKETRKKDITGRQANLKQTYKDRNCFWKGKIEEMNNEGEEKMEWLEKKQAKEVQEFKKKWQDPEFIRQFNKPSTRLLQLRHVEKKLVIIKDYDGAKKTKKLADSLQAKEEKAMQAQIESRMQFEYTKLREKHLYELKKMDAFYKYNQGEVKLKMKKDLETIQKGIKTMEIKKELPVTKRTLITAKKEVKTTYQTEKPPAPSAIPTPRTFNKYSQYKIEKVGDLNLEPVNEDKVSRLPSSSLRPRKKIPQSSISSRFPKF